MTDATTHSHDHDHPHNSVGAADVHAAALPSAAASRSSSLEAPALARLGGLSLVLAALWAGVYWALH
ncbi:MAG: hypothetical protein CTY15_01920 [Methylocystis sp.]|nr:MAG: hypothetical protein CTY15_01920 [Methylocystis sp.]